MLQRLDRFLYLVLEDQMLPQAAERLGEGKQRLVAERLPVVLHHHHSASQLRTGNISLHFTVTTALQAL